MPPEKKDLLAILRRELAFVEMGGYRTPQQAAWRPQFIFQDSPTCLNHRNFGKSIPCTECALIHFVPQRFKQELFPCRQIPLDETGRTLDSLYRTGTEDETYAIVANWLGTSIARLEREIAISSASDLGPDSQVLVARNHR
jgi:hypothetical protein